jgi:UDP-glucose 4-epimerase
MRVLVTGGAGFIGSHLVDMLMARGEEVCVIDNLSTGSLENIKQWLESPRFTFIKGDLLDISDLGDYDIIFHLAANPEVRVSSESPEVHFQQNVVATYNLLEKVRGSKTDVVVFASTSTVYGEASKIPTPEDYAPLKPISVYGASKLACEALISAYAHTYNFRAVIFRLANIVGSRSRHGVIVDFIRKLRRNTEELEVLGDGNQRKSYLHVSDCVQAMLLGLEKAQSRVEVYNIGSEDQVDVRTIARVVVEEMGLKDVRLKFTGGVDGGRGWKGDVKNMLLDITKLRSLGWRPRLNSLDAVRRATKELLADDALQQMGRGKS